MGWAPESMQKAPGLEKALSLLRSDNDDERVLGATFTLRCAEFLAFDAEARRQFLTAVDSSFLERLLQSELAGHRVAVGIMRVLIVDTESATKLHVCLGAVAASCATFASMLDGSVHDSVEEPEAPWGNTDIIDALEVFRQSLKFLPKGQQQHQCISATEDFFRFLLPGGPCAGALTDVEVASVALAVAQELTSYGATGQNLLKLLATCVKLGHGTVTQESALSILVEQMEIGAAPTGLGETLSEAIAGGTRTRPQALHLAAAAIGRFGLSLGLPGGAPSFDLLRPLLSLMSGELQLGLEGFAPEQNTCAACAALEAVITAFGQASAALEESGKLSDVSDCLRQLQRAVSIIHSYCSELPTEGNLPGEVALVARVAAVWQLEDPRQFSSEFQRSLPNFCRLSPVEFAVLLPCIHEMHEWHLTPAFGKIIKIALEFWQEDTTPIGSEVWSQCALMLTEVALDAAAYLPEAPVPDVPAGLEEPKISALAASTIKTPLPTPGVNLPRPLQAADPEHRGVRSLCSWSSMLWRAGQTHAHGQLRFELGLLCGALLTSVPSDSVCHSPIAAASASAIWACVAECLLSGSKVEASTWRLTLRLVGFVLDRHAGITDAIARLATQGGATHLRPPIGAMPSSDDDDDEWAIVDNMAIRVVKDYLAYLAESPHKLQPRQVPAEIPIASLDVMD